MDDNARTGELRRKLEKDPGSRLFGQFAEELRKEGKHDEAISVARKGLEKNPNYPSARLTLARALLDSGRPREARPELEQIVKASPDNIMASRLLGEALEELGELDQAMKQFEKTLIFSPGDKAVTERMAQLKARLTAPLPPTLPPTVPPAVPVPWAAPPPATAAELTAPFPEPAADTLPPSALAGILAAAPLPREPRTPTPMPAPAPSVLPPTSVALDRDLASGTFSPGSLNAGDLQKHFEEASAKESATPAAPPSLLDSGDTVAFGQMEALEPLIAESPAPLEMPAEESDLGSQTLPLSSMTLADLYLQQGLKAEASAVLSQVMKEEPENAQAKSKFAAVSTELSTSAAEAPRSPAPPPISYRSTRAKARDRTVASLRLFASAVEREAVSQRATERGVI